jgi:molecular chaperone GrpE
MAAETGTDIPLADPAETLAKLAQAEQQIADYKSLIADFDNSRKRLAQDADRQRKYAHEGFSRDLLGALDNLDRTIAAAKATGESTALLKGVEATVAQFLEVFKRHNITRIPAEPGTPFDPNVHQAVSQMPTNDYEPGAVAQVLQHGFLLHDRVIRPASVMVAVEPPAGGSEN